MKCSTNLTDSVDAAEFNSENFNQGTFGFFTISKSNRKSERISARQKSPENKFTKKLPPVGFDLPTATITALKSDA